MTNFPLRVAATVVALTSLVSVAWSSSPTFSAFNSHAYLKASNTDLGDRFGFAVAADGDVLVVGAFNESGDVEPDTGEGAVYVYSASAGTPQFVTRLKASNADVGDLFGASVAVSGDTIVVGAPHEASLSGDPGDNSFSRVGAVYVFQRDGGGNWSQLAYLKPSNLAKSRSFGQSVAIDGDVIVIGAPFDSESADGNGEVANSGAAYVFERVEGGWTETAYLKSATIHADDNFGFSVDVSGQTAVIGEPGEDDPGTSNPNVGAAHVFVRGVSAWTQQQRVVSSAFPQSERFGAAVTISGDSLAVGSSAPSSVDVQHRTGVSWSLQATLPESGVVTQRLGASLDLRDNQLLVGDPGDNSLATGVDGARDNSDAPLSGAAYLFERSGSNWTLAHYLKASNTAAFDGNGQAVAMTDTILVVGADREDSNSTGVNGAQHNDLAVDAGAAYVFRQSSQQSVGGRLQGLASGESISLQLNAQETLSMTADGGFLFQTQLNAGDSYNVVISSLPAGQRCTLSNETGVVVAVNPNNVVVTCVADSLRTVGGLVSGLATGASLVLHNNGGDPVSVLQSGEFTFSQGLEDGDTYTVTVATQPIDQTCNVSGGSGTVSGADISNIQVICNGGFTVGGHVLGLQVGNGVRLLNNGSDTLDLGSNGNFTFGTPLADGTAYSVTVGGQPLDQICNVANGSGTIQGASVNNVELQCFTSLFTVGGQISGLDIGDSITLNNNGNDSLQRTANGEFTFAIALADGSTYDVAITSAPTDKRCAVSRGVGSIDGANVLDVSVDCLPLLIFRDGYE